MIKTPHILISAIYISIVVAIDLVKVARFSAQLYWKPPVRPLRYKGWNGLGNYKLLSVILVSVLISPYAAFS